jgi:catechol 2,3-dioxygenase-like lactoylglutathione lyase family enzyme
MSKIEHFAIFTHDLDALRDFYTEVFGLRILLDNSAAPVRGYFLADDGGSVIEIIERPAHEPAPPTRYGCHVAMWVNDYDAMRRSLEARGARFEPETEVCTDSFRTGFFADPAGNRTQIVWRAHPLGS